MTIEERAKAYADNFVVGDSAIIVDLMHKVAKESYIAGATEMEQNPSDALIMRILNCIGYEEGWIGFVRKELEKRKEK